MEPANQPLVSAGNNLQLLLNGRAKLTKQFTIIWHADMPQEREWIDEIFGEYVKSHVFDSSRSLVLDECFLCDAYIRKQNLDYYRRFRGKNAFLIHFLDENYEGPFEVYKNFRGVFRNFWSSAFNARYVKCFPLGYNLGLAAPSSVKPSLSRKYIWSFSGQVNKSSRPDAVTALSSLVPNYLYPTDRLPGSNSISVQSPKSLPTDQYRKILQDSIFAPSPMGNSNLECFRVYEALEQGAIPIVERRATLNYFDALLGPHPLPTISDWGEAKSLIVSLVAAPSRLEDLQHECLSWWQQYKVGLTAEIADFILQTLGDLCPDDRQMYARKVLSKWWQLAELTRHHDRKALGRRIKLQVTRTWKTGTLRKGFRP